MDRKTSIRNEARQPLNTPQRSNQPLSSGNRSPLFSVILPVYNGESFLRQAIDSILRQSLTDFEFLIIDDGSTDDSLSLIREWTASLDNEVLILRHPNGENRGIVSTYELGLAHASGQYVAFLEQDDYWSSRYLEHKAAIFEKYPEAGVVFSPYQIVSDSWFGRDMTLRQWFLRRSMPNNRPFDKFREPSEAKQHCHFFLLHHPSSTLGSNPYPTRSLDRLLRLVDASAIKYAYDVFPGRSKPLLLASKSRIHPWKPTMAYASATPRRFPSYPRRVPR
jgi:glycosyltransferase involved in cell wall biosynthesis